MKYKLTILFLLIGIACSSCSGFDPQAYVPGLYTPTPTPLLETPSPVPPTATLAAATDEPVVTRKVCTNIPMGKLHVRFAPDDSSDVRGYLLEGETVTLSGEQSENRWLKISHPIEGWVNANYLCETQP